MSRPITPPATVGILGGGQLGRYFVMAARTMGFGTMVLDPDPRVPAGAVADVHLVAPFDDPDALARLGAEAAVVTTEFENPPAASLERLAQATVVRPSPAAIAIAQDRRAEKRFLRDLGVPTAPFAVIETEADLSAAGAAGAAGTVGFPAILKTARMGYDGKGQLAVMSADDLPDAWHELGRVACVLERRLPLDREVSVVLGRGIDGAVAVYPIAANIHAGGILDLSVVPVAAPGAEQLAITIAEALGYVGVLAVEFFDVGGELLVNELAPRPHNSGHWTLDGAATDQFEQQVRTVCGLRLGDPALSSGGSGGVAMANLLGDRWEHGEPDWAAALSGPGTHLHLYGKAEARVGRKMGHLTVVAADPDTAAGLALAARDAATRSARSGSPD